MVDDELRCPECDAVLKEGIVWTGEGDYEGYSCPNGCDISDEYD